MDCKSTTGKISKLCRQLRVLWKRENGQETHKHLWMEFEWALKQRANLAMIGNFIKEMSCMLLGVYAFQLTPEYMEDNDNPCNREVVQTILPFATWILIVMNLGRIPLMLASLKKPDVCKYYLYYELITAVVRESLPIDYGDVHTQNVLILNFAWMCMYGFNFWRNTGALLLYTGYVLVVVRAYLYEDEKGMVELVANFIMSCIWLIYNCAFIHIVISWIGFKFVAAEMPRNSNERLLNNLKEGVVIID